MYFVPFNVRKPKKLSQYFIIKDFITNQQVTWTVHTLCVFYLNAIAMHVKKKLACQISVKT